MIQNNIIDVFIPSKNLSYFCNLPLSYFDSKFWNMLLKTSFDMANNFQLFCLSNTWTLHAGFETWVLIWMPLICLLLLLAESSVLSLIGQSMKQYQNALKNNKIFSTLGQVGTSSRAWSVCLNLSMMPSLFFSRWVSVAAVDWLVKMNSATSALSSWMFWMNKAISMAPLTCFLTMLTLAWYPIRVFMVTLFCDWSVVSSARLWLVDDSPGWPGQWWGWGAGPACGGWRTSDQNELWGWSCSTQQSKQCPPDP